MKPESALSSSRMPFAGGRGTSLESRLYRWGWVIFIVVAGAAAVKRLFFPDFDLVSHMLPCAFFALTGYYCPGCGGTRSVAALLTGRWLVCAVDFPMVAYSGVVYAWFMISHTVEKLSRRRIAIGMRFRVGWIYAALVIVLIHWAVKNIYYIQTGTAPFL